MSTTATVKTVEMNTANNVAETPELHVIIYDPDRRYRNTLARFAWKKGARVSECRCFSSLKRAWISERPDVIIMADSGSSSGSPISWLHLFGDTPVVMYSPAEKQAGTGNTRVKAVLSKRHGAGMIVDEAMIAGSEYAKAMANR